MSVREKILNGMPYCALVQFEERKPLVDYVQIERNEIVSILSEKYKNGKTLHFYNANVFTDGFREELQSATQKNGGFFGWHEFEAKEPEIRICREFDYFFIHVQVMEV